MAPTPEDRLRALEGFRYTMLGHVNACETLLITLWVNTIPRLKGDPVEIAELLRSQWLLAATRPARDFPGADPTHLDAVGQEYRDAIDNLSRQIVEYFRNLESRDDKERE